MAWSTTAPTLPDGSAWDQTQSTSVQYNYWTLKTEQSIARLADNQIGVRVVATASNGSYGSFISPGKYSLQCNIDGVTGTADTSYTLSKGTQTFYFTGDAQANVTVVSICGYADSTASKTAGTVSFTAPAILVSSKLWKKISGVWTQVATLKDVTL